MVVYWLCMVDKAQGVIIYHVKSRETNDYSNGKKTQDWVWQDRNFNNLVQNKQFEMLKTFEC